MASAEAAGSLQHEDIRAAIRALVKARATRAALAGKGLTPLMVTAVTAEFLRAGNHDGTCIQVGIATVAEVLGVSHMSVSRVRKWLIDQGIGHFESGARQGAKATWWHLSLTTSAACCWCAPRQSSLEHGVHEPPPEHHVQETEAPSPEHHSRTPLLNTTPEHHGVHDQHDQRTNSISQKRARAAATTATADLTDPPPPGKPPPQAVDAWLAGLSAIAKQTITPNAKSQAAVRHALDAGHSPPEAWTAILAAGHDPHRIRGGAILAALHQLTPTAKVLALARDPWRARLPAPTSPCDRHPHALALDLTRNQCSSCRADATAGIEATA